RGDAIEARKNPPIFESLSLESSNARVGRTLLSVSGPEARLNPVHVHEHESRRIPDLVGKCPVAVGAALVERNVSTRRSHGRQSETSRISTKAVDDLQRIDNVPLGLRHLLPLSIADQRVNIDVMKRHAVVFEPRPAIRFLDSRILLVVAHEVASE